MTKMLAIFYYNSKSTPSHEPLKARVPNTKAAHPAHPIPPSLNKTIWADLVSSVSCSKNMGTLVLGLVF